MKQSSMVMTRPNLFLVVALLAVMLALMGTPAAHAVGVIVVNSDADTVADDGFCSLREAITAANSDSASGATAGECAAGAGPDSITFAADYTITLVGSQLPAVTSEMTITGNGAANTIIQANANPNTATYRVLQVTSTGNLTLDGVTVRHGRCAGSCNSYPSNGGGIFNAGGTLSVTNSTISGNSAGTFGGGIYNSYPGMLTVTNSTLSGNSAGTFGGGIVNDIGTLTVTNSTLSGNSANTGGGIYNHGTGTMLTVTNSTLSSNSANSSGGGIANNGGRLTVTNSTFSGNSAGDSGGGIYNSGTLTMTNSTLSGNSVTPSFFGGGGGIYNSGGTLTVTNSTLSGNSSTTPVIPGGGDEVYTSSSITANATNVFGHDGQDNAAAFFNFTPGASDFNATTDGTPTALASILDTALADNGGPTQTHALVAGSPAIDFAGACGLLSDQRGVARPQGAACDAGAFELVTNQPPTADAGGPYLVAVNSSIAFDGSGSSDPDGDSLTETWSADGGTVAGSTYTAGAVPGIYDVCLTVNDGTVDSDPDCTMVVVYDPSGGFVTGGGWIDSPAGAYTAEPDLSGKATFGFVAKYKKGANVPDGNTSFAFDLAGLAFYSDSYEWLVVNQGGTNAQFKGSGTVNGALDLHGNPYKFMLWAGDGSPDTFRIKIWSEDANGIETVVYDNGFEGSGYETGQPIGGGNIVVHKGKK